MQKMKPVQAISIGGLLTAITILFQSAPVFLPGIGMAFSPVSTLPIAVAAVMSVFLGVSVLISATLILMLVSVQEAMILVFTTGLFGIILGSLIYRKGRLFTLLTSTIGLSGGMLLLTYIVAIPGFSEVTASLSFFLTLLLYIAFSLLYSGIWSVILRKFVALLIRIKLIEKPTITKPRNTSL